MTSIWVYVPNPPVEWGPTIRPTRAEIDLNSVVENSRLLTSWADSELFAVVKADAYGHGACRVAQALQSAQSVAGFAVSLVEEGIELRKCGIELPILVMGPSLEDGYDALVDFSLTPLVSEIRHLQPLHASAAKSSTSIAVHLKVDTGMGRLGILPRDLSSAMQAVDALSCLKLAGVGSHLACADTDDPADLNSMTNRQIDAFSKVRESLNGRSLLFHLANSDGLARFSRAHADFARPGIGLYGNGTSAPALSQTMRLISHITQLRHVAVGESVSYGATWVAQRESTLAIVPIGYADGYPRNLSGNAHVLIQGQSCAIAGRVSMDMIVIDVTDLHSVARGEEVVLWGRQGESEIRISQIARQAGISEYEVTCGISKRVPRVYISPQSGVDNV